VFSIEQLRKDPGRLRIGEDAGKFVLEVERKRWCEAVHNIHPAQPQRRKAFMHPEVHMGDDYPSAPFLLHAHPRFATRTPPPLFLRSPACDPWQGKLNSLATPQCEGY
jgi:hypothetical protein